MNSSTDGTRAEPARALPVRVLLRLSAAIAAFEKVFAAVLIALVAILILLNVATRSLNQALYWVDEAAIDVMVWATLVAASLLVRQRRLIAVTLVLDMLRPPGRRLLNIVIDLIVLGFAAYFLWLCWIWFAPFDLARAGFDLGAFVARTGNFIYGEPTLTIGIPKFWIWLIVPVFSLTLLVHAMANLAETLGGASPEPAHIARE